MCEYSENNICKLTKEVCPWMYFCDNLQIWRANNFMPKDCKVKNANVIKHKGKYQVRNSRKNYIYVDIDGHTYKFENPFDFVPDYVDVVKQRNGQYKIKKLKGE